MSSQLSRRKFFTGAAVTSVVAAYTQIGSAAAEFIPLNVKQEELFNQLHAHNPDVDEDIKRDVARKYGDYKLSIVHALAAGGAAGAVYGYLELRADDEPVARNKNTMLDKVMAGFASGIVTDRYIVPSLANIPVQEILDNMEQYGDRLIDEQKEIMTLSTAYFLYSREYGQPGIMPALVTAAFKEPLENYLDKQDVNINTPDGP